jgi:hypothetical protein
MLDVMEVIQIARKGIYMSSMERFHIFCTQKENKYMNEILFDLENPIFETVYTITHNILSIEAALTTPE